MKSDEGLVFESPNGGKTIYARKRGSLDRRIVHEDPIWKKEQELSERWIRLKEAVFMADSDPTLNDALTKLEILYALKKK